MMQHSISSANTHQDQDPSRSPVPLTPQSSWSHLSECPAPPARCADDFFDMESNTPSIYMPMLTSTLSHSSEWEESPILRPRPSDLSLEHTQDYTVISKQIVSSPSYLHFSSEGSCCPSPAALEDESCSLSDESAYESFANSHFMSELSSKGFSPKDSTIWACPPLPSMMNAGDSPTSVRLHPRSLPSRSTLPLMPMEF